MSAGPDNSRTVDGRRDLVFADLSEVMPEVERLQAGGHRSTGRWTLAQVCVHLADSFTGSMDGFGVRRHRLMRVLFGRTALRRVFQTDSIDSGFTVTEKLNPPAQPDSEATVKRLASAIDRFQSHTGPLHFHPFFGRLTRPEWDHLHRIHCAHHLSRLIPL
ncbi:MAG: DUF1569 domain-containing protein [Phycisphaerae bacterium]